MSCTLKVTQRDLFAIPIRRIAFSIQNLLFFMNWRLSVRLSFLEMNTNPSWEYPKKTSLDRHFFIPFFLLHSFGVSVSLLNSIALRFVWDSSDSVAYTAGGGSLFFISDVNISHLICDSKSYKCKMLKTSRTFFCIFFHFTFRFEILILISDHDDPHLPNISWIFSQLFFLCFTKISRTQDNDLPFSYGKDTYLNIF